MPRSASRRRIGRWGDMRVERRGRQRRYQNARSLLVEKRQTRCFGTLQRPVHLRHRDADIRGQLGIGRALIAARDQGQQEVEVLRFENGLAVDGS